LRSKGVTQVFVAGIATSFGVESTARSAYDLGYHVVLVSDAMTDMDIVAHNHAIEKVFPRLGQVDTAHNIIEKLHSRTSVAAP
jgi:nicotinamidase-related amidase